MSTRIFCASESWEQSSGTKEVTVKQLGMRGQTESTPQLYKTAIPQTPETDVFRTDNKLTNIWTPLWLFIRTKMAYFLLQETKHLLVSYLGSGDRNTKLSEKTEFSSKQSYRPDQQWWRQHLWVILAGAREWGLLKSVAQCWVKRGSISGLLCDPKKLVPAPEKPVNRDLEVNSRQPMGRERRCE